MSSKPDMSRILYDFALSSRCSAASLICAEIYFMRFCKKCPSPVVNSQTCRRIIAACLVLGMKFAEEHLLSNDDLAYDLGVPSEIFNECEKEMAYFLDFKLFVSEADYVQARGALELLIEQENLISVVQKKAKRPFLSPLIRSSAQENVAFKAQAEDSIEICLGDLDDDFQLSSSCKALNSTKEKLAHFANKPAPLSPAAILLPFEASEHSSFCSSPSTTILDFDCSHSSLPSHRSSISSLSSNF
eukprot:c1324_g1_i1.p1 GENE.c1324_g1_i1~~c1324_g1_i1.p1  ORF type:complete len:245 (-),score=47.36 c1324_g1_i1:38-772(-)